MKNAYKAPEMEVITFENEDIITTSGIAPDIDGLPVIEVPGIKPEE
ncbi:MAG: hypothetical protein K2J36_08255 [Ruminococcus sp.]|nr:hypothetical protein [Ruminococcus sp.]